MDATKVHDRLMEAQRRLRQRTASEVIELGWGRAYACERLPLMYDFNLVVVEGQLADTAGGVDESTVIAGVEDAASQLGWDHRKLEVGSAQLAAALAPGLVEAGYVQQTLATMRFEPGVGTSDIGHAAVVPAEAQKELARAIVAEAPWATSEAVLDCFAERDRWFEELGLVEFIVAPAGAPAARALLFDHGEIAEIDSVTTLETERRHGYSAMIMALAVSLARERGVDDVMLVADPEDWPYRWYERLGFAPTGTFAQFDRVTSKP